MSDDRQRRLAAYRAAKKTLRRDPTEAPLGAALSQLSAGVAAVHDTDAATDEYGDGIVEVLEERVATLLGFPAAAYFPTGTMAQQVALRAWAGRTGNPVVALHPLAHPELHEAESLTTVCGLRTVHTTDAARLPTPAEVQGIGEPFGTLMLELPLREAGFILPTWDELVATVEAARERKATIHFDGARLWECTAHFGRGLAEIAGLADSVYVSLYKSLGAISGAVLAGPQSLVDEAKVWRHRYGGRPYQQYPAVVSALLGLDRELPRLPSYVAQARMVVDVLREELTELVPWFRIAPETAHTHQFKVWLPHASTVLRDAGVAQAEETGVVLFRGWWSSGAMAPPGIAVTEVTVGAEGLDWSAEDVRAAVRDFVARLP
ncbi:threonine aldolase family protein [Pseudonocardia sp. GCM10023141]|uniref:threonine aldolase family protein n=1 Tax=Pseudonocardia sp. GCM10023141 TaxID=3252653 RepID=UPI003623A347